MKGGLKFASLGIWAYFTIFSYHLSLNNEWLCIAVKITLAVLFQHPIQQIKTFPPHKSFSPRKFSMREQRDWEFHCIRCSGASTQHTFTLPCTCVCTFRLDYATLHYLVGIHDTTVHIFTVALTSTALISIKTSCFNHVLTVISANMNSFTLVNIFSLSAVSGLLRFNNLSSQLKSRRSFSYTPKRALPSDFGHISLNYLGYILP